MDERTGHLLRCGLERVEHHSKDCGPTRLAVERGQGHHVSRSEQERLEKEGLELERHACHQHPITWTAKGPAPDGHAVEKS